MVIDKAGGPPQWRHHAKGFCGINNYDTPAQRGPTIPMNMSTSSATPYADPADIIDRDPPFPAVPHRRNSTFLAARPEDHVPSCPTDDPPHGPSEPSKDILISQEAKPSPTDPFRDPFGEEWGTRRT